MEVALVPLAQVFFGRDVGAGFWSPACVAGVRQTQTNQSMIEPVSVNITEFPLERIGRG